jgi:cytochrome P450
MTELRVESYQDAYAALCEPALRQSLYDAGSVIMDSVLLTLHGAAHKARRQLELRVFRRELLKEYEREVFPPTLQRTLAPFVAAGRADLVDFGYRVTMNLTADFAGIDRPLGTPAETLKLLELVRTFSEGATLVHSTRDHADVRREVEAALVRFVDEFLAPSMARRRVLLEQDTPLERLDVLTTLLANEDRIDLSEDVLVREIGFYLQAGAHSTANSMVHAIDELFGWISRVPADAQARNDRVRDEPGFLQRCVHESLRLHPASPVAWRTPVEPVTLRDGRRLEPGDRLVIDLARANCDPAVFGEDAATFNPERRISSEPTIGARKIPPFGLTFGIGVHLCPGRDLDGGIADDDASLTRMRGIVTMLVEALLSHGVRRDPDVAPIRDQTTERSNWAQYPVLLEAAA